MTWAYYTDKTRSAMHAREHDAFKLIQHCGKWNYIQWGRGDTKGILAYWGQVGPSAGDLPEGIETDKGLIYFKPAILPTQKDLAKSTPLPCIDYMTHKGFNLSIPLAVDSPRSVSFTGKEFGDWVDDFPRFAANLEARIHDSIKDDDVPMILTSDPLAIELVCLAIEQTYSVTSELLTDLGWITSRDIEPIIEIVLGGSPLVLSDDETTSNSLSQELNETPNVHQENGKK